MAEIIFWSCFGVLELPFDVLKRPHGSINFIVTCIWNDLFYLVYNFIPCTLYCGRSKGRCVLRVTDQLQSQLFDEKRYGNRKIASVPLWMRALSGLAAPSQYVQTKCIKNIYIAGADEHVMTGRPFSLSLPASLSCFMQTGRNSRRAALIKCCFVGGISGGGSAHSIWLFIQSYSQYIHTAAAPTTPALPIPFYRKMSLTFFKNKSCETCSFTDSESKCYFFTLNHPVFRVIKLYLAFYIHPSCQEMALITSIIIPWIFIAFDKWLIMYSGMTV